LLTIKDAVTSHSLFDLARNLVDPCSCFVVGGIIGIGPVVATRVGKKLEG